MSTAFRIDHIVIMVNDLAKAVEDYSALGFTVLDGGVHEANPTHNALVVFEDGVYLEIIALREQEPDRMSSRLRKWVRASPGLVDMALLPGDIEADIAAARSRGVDIEDAASGGRLRPDGQQIEWKTANLKGAGLPFFCADVTSRSFRVPEGDARRHANAAAGVADVTIAVADLGRSRDQYRALLGLEPESSPVNGMPAAESCTFLLKGSTITLAQPQAGNSPLRAYLDSGGERPYSFTLHTTIPDQAGDLDLGQSHGARIKLVDLQSTSGS